MLESENILRTLAHESSKQPQTIKGWRILSKTSLQEQEIALLIKELQSLGKIIHSNIQSYSSILGDEKAKSFKEDIEKIKLSQYQ